MFQSNSSQRTSRKIFSIVRSAASDGPQNHVNLYDDHVASAG